MSCFQCRDSGWIVATNKINKTLFSFRCECVKGSCISQSVQSWSQSMNSIYLKDDPIDVTNKPTARETIKPPRVDYQAKQANDFDEEEIPF